MLDQMPLPDCPMLFHAACVQLRAQNCPNYHGNSQSNLQIRVIRRWSLCHDSIEQLRYETPMQLQKSIGHGSLTRLAQLGIAGWQKVQGCQMFSTTSPQRQTWKRGKIMACRGASWWGRWCWAVLTSVRLLTLHKSLDNTLMEINHVQMILQFKCLFIEVSACHAWPMENTYQDV